MKHLVKSRIGFVFFMGLSGVFLANIAFWGFKQNAVLVFVSTFFGWSFYLAAHYMMEGKFIDGNEGEEEHQMRPDKWKELSGITTGAAVLISGMALGVISIKSSNLGLTIIAGIMFHTGYVIAHYSATNELV